MGERTRELTLLLLGDVIVFIVSLWITLLLRYWEWPSLVLFSDHLGPLLILSTVWLFVFYLAGMYDKHTVFLKSFLLSRIINAQIMNGVVALCIFIVLPFGIAPKTNLFIYVLISVAFLTWWRMFIYPKFLSTRKYKAILLASGPEAIELVDEINNNDRYDYSFVRIIDEASAQATTDFESKLLQLIDKEKIDIIVANPNGTYITAVLPKIFNLAFIDFKLTFLDFYKVYEDTFDRVPLSALRYEWFITHVSQSKSLVYDFLKRVVDICGSLILGTCLLVCLPFIYIAMRLEGPGEIFITQDRIGRFNQPMKVHKIRTMTANRRESATWTVEDAKDGVVVTKVGAILRKLSIDELPQVWAILKGEMSLIGPRNDIKGLGERMAEMIPYYNIRNFVKPGVTGWAQTHQRYMGNNISPQSLEETKTRLSFDLYYIKNRSLLLDVDIALRTFKTLLSRFGIVIKLR